MAKIHSEKKPGFTKYGLPWCKTHDAYAPRRYDPFIDEIRGRKVAMYLCDQCYADSAAEI